MDQVTNTDSNRRSTHGWSRKLGTAIRDYETGSDFGHDDTSAGLRLA